MQRYFRIWFMAAILFVGACAPKAAGPQVETMGDVTFVHNPATPLHPDRTVVFEEELTFGGDDGPEEAILYRPRTVLVDESDYVYVSDYQDAVIKVFDPDGNYVRTIGRKYSSVAGCTASIPTR